MTSQTAEKVIVCCDMARTNGDMTALLVALEREGKIEIVEHITAEPGSKSEDEIRALLAGLEFPALEKPLPAPSNLPYYRQFERKRRAR